MGEAVDSGVVESLEETKGLCPLAAVLQKGAGGLVDCVQYQMYSPGFGVLGWGVKKQFVIEVLDWSLSVEMYGVIVEGTWQIGFGIWQSLSSSESDSFYCALVLLHPLHSFSSQLTRVLVHSHYHTHVWGC